MKGADFFVPISQYLADEEFVVYTKEFIFSAFKYAIRFLVQNDAIQFTDIIKMPLQKGTTQFLPDNVVSFINFSDIIRRVDREMVALSTRLSCIRRSKNSPYSIESFAYNDDTPRVVYVFPPVPEGYNGTVDIIATIDPNPKSYDEDIKTDNSLSSVIFSLMLFYIGTAEFESVSLKEMAAQHYKSAIDQLSLNKSAPSLVKKEDKIKDNEEY